MTQTGNGPGGTAHNRGAALIMAVAILAVLLAIALAFFSSTKVEMNIATNTVNKVRVDLLSDATLALAMATLNQDLLRHPNATSTDHPWRSLYNGAWAAGKPWAMRRNGATPISMSQGGVPEVNLLKPNFPAYANSNYVYPLWVVFADGHREVLYRGERSRDWLYYPRVEAFRGTDLDLPNGSPAVLYDANAILIDSADPPVAVTPVYRYNPELPYDATPQTLNGITDVPPSYLPFVTSSYYGTVGVGSQGFTPMVDGTLNALFPVPDKETDPTKGGDGGSQYPREQVDTFADVDLDNDGLKDAVWLPLPQDRFYPDDGLDNDLDGMIDETQDNGVNDDHIPGVYDNEPESIWNSTDQVTRAQAIDFDIDEAIEAGVFAYYGGDDGLDNDGNGLVDEGEDLVGEDGYNETGEIFFLTAPLPGERIPVDLNNDGISPDTVPICDATCDSIVMEPLYVILPDTITVRTVIGDIALTAANVDVLDNDHNMLVNDFFAYAYIGPNTQWETPPKKIIGFGDDGTVIYPDVNVQNSAVALTDPGYYDRWLLPNNWAADDITDPIYSLPRALAYHEIKVDSALNNAIRFEPPVAQILRNGAVDDKPIYDWLTPHIRITHSGEPMCDIVGRAAVYITDEASRVNVNVAGGHVYNPGPPLANSSVNAPNIMRALGDGASPHEYETRVLPEGGIARSGTLWSVLTGNPKGGADEVGIYSYDVQLPGYSRADDNGNAWIATINGLDDDGDGLIDEGAFLPRLSVQTRRIVEGIDAYSSLSDERKQAVFDELKSTRFADYANALGYFEGVDEPGEMQRFQGLRNFLAERDTIDNDADARDSFGFVESVVDEFGELGDAVFQKEDQVPLRTPSIADGVYGVMANDLTAFSTDRNVNMVPAREGLRVINKLDPNFATAQQLAASLIINGRFEPVTTATKAPPIDLYAGGVPMPSEIPYIFDPDGTTTRGFALGLRQGDIHLSAPVPTGTPLNNFNLATNYLDQIVTGGGFLHVDGDGDPLTDDLIPTTVPPYHELPADAQIRAMQMATDLVDNRDRDHVRSVLRTPRLDSITGDDAGVVNWPRAGATFDPVSGLPNNNALNQRETYAPEEILPLEDIQDHLNNTLDIQDLQTDVTDDWWKGFVTVDSSIDPDVREQRRFSYTTTGSEAIKINELMVRPVRRVETEMIRHNLEPLSDMDPMFPFLANTSPFEASPEFIGLVNRFPFPDFNMDRREHRTNLAEPFDWLLGDPAGIASLGEGVGLRTTEALAVNGEPNILVFTFSDEDIYESGINGLPSGRYYLMVKTDAEPGELQYNIRYRDLSEGAGPAIQNNAFVPTNWRIVPGEHFSSQISGAPTGWVFLDATPADILDGTVNAPAPDNFAEFPFRYQRSLSNGADSICLVIQSDHDPDDGEINGFYVTISAGPTILAGSLTSIVLTDTTDTLTVTSLTFPQLLELDFTGEDVIHMYIPNTGTVFSPTEFSNGSITIEAVLNTVTTGPQVVQSVFGGDCGELAPTHTVSIPEFPADTSGTPRRMVLDVAIAPVDNNPDPFDGFTIDAFDFTQEPDHEYVELLNTSGEAVDVSGWELEVGIPDPHNIQADPNRGLWSIPDGTTVAPGGMLLLAFDKFDSYFQLNGISDFDDTSANGSDNSLINRNGMGMAAGGYAFPGDGYIPFIQEVTVPPIADVSASAAADVRDVSGSVFYRFDDLETTGTNEFVDYVDRDGDGLTSAYLVEIDATLRDGTSTRTAREIDALTDRSIQDNDVRSTQKGTSASNAPWDRIVELVNEELRGSGSLMTDLANSGGGVDALAAFLLRGGALPNYPEHDGIDNDGDGGYIDRIGNYVPGVLEKDMVDNDLDGIIDERGMGYSSNTLDDDSDGVTDELGEDLLNDGLDTNGDGLIDEPGDESDPLLSEGVDEGRGFSAEAAAIGVPWRRWGAGTFEAGVLPISFLNDRAVYTDIFFSDLTDPRLVDPDGTVATPGVGIDASLTSVLNIDDLLVRAGYLPDDLLGIATGTPYANVDAPYLGSDADPPDWKAFTERRWYPGDNVIVTLYQGLAENDQVADRVTYREYDVINRTVDDMISRDLDGDGTDEFPALHLDYPTWWTPNHMALDFYRALERKSPHYNGDRFGTTNRWEPTDGNYDDWSESIALVELTRFPVKDPANVLPLAFPSDVVTDSLVARFLADGVTNAHLKNLQLLGHSLWGSPLRMNVATRMSENPMDLARVLDAADSDNNDPIDQFKQLDHYVDAYHRRINAESRHYENRGWNQNKVAQRDRNFESPGNLTSVPGLIYAHQMVNTTRVPGLTADYLLGMNGLNTSILFTDTEGLSRGAYQDMALRGATLGMDDTDGEMADVMAKLSDSLAVNSLVLTVGQAEFKPVRPRLSDAELEAILDWNNFRGQAPGAWAPVFLTDIGGGATTPGRLPYYPAYFDGATTIAQVPVYGLFNPDFILNAGIAFGNTFLPAPLNIADLQTRWPMEQRVAMYVSDNPSGISNSPDTPEALFIWDGADGIENGEYMVYIATYTRDYVEQLGHMADLYPGMVSQTLQDPRPPSTDTVTVNAAAPLQFVTDFTINVLSALNPGAEGRLPQLALDVITDPAKARGFAPQGNLEAPGLTHPDDWNPDVRYQPDSHGIISYGSGTGDEWRPQMVRVTDNFLALRVRNVGDAGQVASITHVILAPRKRTPGRINVNTAESRIAANGDLYSVLFGVPGVVDALRTVRPLPISALDDATPIAGPISPSEPLGLPGDSTGSAWLAPEALAPSADVPARFGSIDPSDPIATGNYTQAFARLSALIMANRTEHPDGRYYDSPGSLILRDERPFGGDITIGTYPLSNESDPERRFDEVTSRFGRMANTITTRSDVFRIRMLVQAGYAIDTNGDGRYNYRSNDEFVSTATVNSEVVYERRTPSDKSDEATAND
ncbi:MAG: hypothetical protein HYV27_06715 [Candidatus Hydrogenedentes bacterium]|nr:hypothetical protein [Candidatus Hydrogenedentota bacterium]